LAFCKHRRGEKDEKEKEKKGEKKEKETNNNIAIWLNKD